MFIDDIKHRYTYLNSMKNIVHEDPVERSVVADRTVIIDPDIEPVLDKLMRERPTWRFKSTANFYGHAGVRSVSNFEIYDGDEKLGHLWVERHWRDSSVRYYFNNFRLEKTRQRNSVSYTSKADTAAKRIIKAFHLKTPSERATEAFNDVRNSLSKIGSEANWPLRRAKNVIEKRLYAYAANHWDEIKADLTDDTTLDFPAVVQADRDAADMYSAFEGQGGSIVRIEANGTYMASRRSDAGFAVETFTDSTLPDHVRGGLGLLKLVDDNTAIPGVGTRVNSKLYFVIDKKGESDAE